MIFRQWPSVGWWFILAQYSVSNSDNFSLLNMPFNDESITGPATHMSWSVELFYRIQFRQHPWPAPSCPGQVLVVVTAVSSWIMSPHAPVLTWWRHLLVPSYCSGGPGLSLPHHPAFNSYKSEVTSPVYWITQRQLRREINVKSS